jgi:hypothetical protein
MDASTIYAEPRSVTDLADCYFYHTMDVPGYGRVDGEWDLRDGVGAYLGGVDFKGKRVLEVGTASGFLCFHMEKQGAEVVAYDLAEDQSWNVVPFAGYDHQQHAAAAREHVRRVNNAFWLCHAAFGSHARKVHGTAYTVPEAIGAVDVVVCGCVLLHLRDPFLALQRALRLARQTVVVTEPVQLRRWPQLLLRLFGGSCMVFLPDFRTCQPRDTWWFLPPTLLQQFLGVLGFEDTKVCYHRQTFGGRPRKMYTVVGHRTRQV